LKIIPNLPDALLGLANSFLEQENFIEAEKYYTQFLKINPDIPGVYSRLGTTLRAQNRYSEACEQFQAAINLKPDYLAAYRRLGETLTAMGAHNKAEKCYRIALELQPDGQEILLALGNSLMCQQKNRQAEEHYTSALKHFSSTDTAEPNAHFAAECLYKLGHAFERQWKYAEAKASYRKALDTDPESLRNIVAIAEIMEVEGDYDGASELLEPLLEGKPEKILPAAAVIFARLSRRNGRLEEACSLLEQQLTRKDLNLAQRKKLHFTLAPIYDRLEKYDDAFDQCREGNELLDSDFDIQQCRSEFDGLISAFSLSKQACRPRASIQSELPVFIVGMPRSGTSLVEQILASHPDVYGAGELDDVSHIFESLPNTLGTNMSVIQCLDALTENVINGLAQQYIDRLTEVGGNALRITDKMPHNFLHLGFIELLFPRARVLHCVRDPLDNCLSCYFQQFNRFHDYTGNLEHLGFYYNQYRRLMAHWKETLRIPVFEVQYEDLVANQKAVSQSMLQFCGLDWDERCLEFHKTGRLTVTHSYDQVRRPMYKSSMKRWKNYEKFLDPLKAALKGD
jgi:tetratricopeptide (TPR) repeat protein